MKRCVFTGFILVLLTFFAVQVVLANETASIGAAEENYQKLFLRQSAVLLKQGSWRFDLGFRYDRNQAQLFLSNYDINRQLSLDMTLNYGLLKQMEVFVSVPIAWAENTLRVGSDESRDNEFGIGDSSIGTRFLIHPETDWPEIVASLSASFPTGKNPYTNNVNLGSGHYIVSTGITVIKSADPVVLFGGLSFNYPFEAEFNGVDIRLGWSIGYNFGLGLAFNDKLILSGSFVGSYHDKTRGDHPKIANVSVEPLSFQTGFTYIVNNDFTIEPSVAFGLNDDAFDTSVGFAFSWAF